MVYRNSQAVCASWVMALPKMDTFRMFIDYPAATKQTEPVPAPMALLKLVDELFTGLQAFRTLGLLQGYWQCHLAVEAQEQFTTVTNKGLFTPIRVPQGVLNATACLQGMMTSVLGGLIEHVYVVYFDDVLLWAPGECKQLARLKLVLERRVAVGMFAAVHKTVCYAQTVHWCGKIYLGSGVPHDPEHVWGLLETRGPASYAF